MASNLQRIRPHRQADAQSDLRPPWKRYAPSRWCEELMEGAEVSNTNELERYLEPHLFKPDAEGRLHGSGKYRHHLQGEDFPSERTRELAKPYLRGRGDPLGDPLWRFFGDTLPSRTEWWSVLESLKAGVQAQVLHFLAEVKDSRSDVYRRRERLRAIQMEGGYGLDGLSGLLVAAMETRGNISPHYHACAQIELCFAGIVASSSYRYSHWRAELFPELAKRYLCHGLYAADPIPEEDPVFQQRCSIISHGMLRCSEIVGGLLGQFTEMRLLATHPRARWAFLTEFHPFRAIDGVNFVQAVKDGVVTKPTLGLLGESLKSWVTTANQYA